ncbi:hypothetical protein DMA11_13860 [Marinilabiliaceae bacterium JC017]|nr:hypothetical protein DMA11_13860 [Marinilabiliaceae bacterium JC017]
MKHKKRSLNVDNSQKRSRRKPSLKIDAVQKQNNGAFILRSRDNFTQKQRESILAKNAKKNKGFHVCAFCGFSHTHVTYATKLGKRLGDGCFQVDHIIPASKGGRALVKNAAVLCGTCNISKGNRDKPKRFGCDKYKGLNGKNKPRDYKKIKRKY